MSRSVQYVYRSQNLLKRIWNASVQFQKKIRKISVRRSRSPKYAELGSFMLLFCRGRGLRNVQRFITHVHSYWNLLFCGVLVAVAVVVCLSSREFPNFLGFHSESTRLAPADRVFTIRPLIRCDGPVCINADLEMKTLDENVLPKL